MGNHYERERVQRQLAGVPTLPDELLRQFTQRQSTYVEPEPTGDLLEECKASLEAACREIRRRYERGLIRRVIDREEAA